MELGITVVGDGEMSKPSYVSYVSQRLTGLVLMPIVLMVITMMSVMSIVTQGSVLLGTKFERMAN